MDKGTLDVAEAAIKSAVQKNPRSPSRILAQFALAEIYQRQEKYTSALEILQPLLSDSTAERDRVRALLLAGEISFQNRDFPSAVYFYQHLSQRQAVPQVIGQAFLGMGEAYLAWGKSDSALACYRQISRFQSPTDQEISFRLGELL